MEDAMNADDELVQNLTAMTAVQLETLCANGAVVSPNERDHLSKACKMAAAAVASEMQVPPVLSPFGFGPLLGWIGLGNVDLVFRWPDRQPIFVELKCGCDLTDCVWDVVKLSAAVLHGNAETGYLLAGAPVARWDAGTPGGEFFEEGVWETRGRLVRDAYVKSWRRWQNEAVRRRPNRHIPGLIATAFRTVALGRYPFSVAGVRWEIRAARVDPAGSESVVWKCV